MGYMAPAVSQRPESLQGAEVKRLFRDASAISSPRRKYPFPVSSSAVSRRPLQFQDEASLNFVDKRTGFSHLFNENARYRKDRRENVLLR